MTEKSSYNILQDYDKKRIVPGYRYCCKKFLGICIRHCRVPDRIYYDPYNVGTTNNILNLEKIILIAIYNHLTSHIINYTCHLMN